MPARVPFGESTRARCCAQTGGSPPGHFPAVLRGRAVKPTILGSYNSTGWAGYYSVPNDNRLANGDRVTGVRTTFFLRQRAETTAANLGVELCRASTVFPPLPAPARRADSSSRQSVIPSALCPFSTHRGPSAAGACRWCGHGVG